MNAVEFLLASFDDSWSHQWESVSSVLEGVTPVEAAWQHPAYAGVEPEEGLPLPGTILWHIAHLEYCTRFYADILRLRPATDNPPVVLPVDLSLSALLDTLPTARKELRRQIALLSESELEEEYRPGRSIAEFLRAVLRHESWHGGQIALVRRLYRESLGAGEEEGASAGERILALHHAQITVSSEDVEAARTFYCETLGLPEVPKPESLQGRGGFWFSVGDRNIHVGVEEGVERTKTKGHLAYQVTDLEGWRNRLVAKGIIIFNGIPIPGHNRFEFRDPFGNRVEFIEAEFGSSASAE